MTVLPMHISAPSKRRGGGEAGDGGLCMVEGGREEVLLCEAHNLIIQSIEQHIHFIVLQISSPDSAASLEESSSVYNNNQVHFKRSKEKKRGGERCRKMIIFMRLSVVVVVVVSPRCSLLSSTIM